MMMPPCRARRRAALVAFALLAGASPMPRVPVGPDILFWPAARRAQALPHMERLFTGAVVSAAHRAPPARLGAGLPVAPAEIAAFMARQHAAGIVVWQNGRVRLARYAAGFGPRGRWASFSIAKSVTSTLVGAAVRDGLIGSLDDPLTRYLPGLAGSAYDGVSVRQLLSMRTGVAWNEDYTDPASDVARLYAIAAPRGADRTLAYMARLARAAPPGMRWNYNTGEADLAGVLVRSVAHRPLAGYLAERLWRPAGMASDAFWMTDAAGDEVGGSGLSMTLADEARFGQLALDGGDALVPRGWFAAATRDAGGASNDGKGNDGKGGYGEGWWDLGHGRFAALGIFGQAIVVDRASRTVIVIAAAWPTPTDPALSADRSRFIDRLVAARAVSDHVASLARR